jgi:clan AA aspartic protease
MIRGQVRPNGEAAVGLKLLGAGGRAVEVTAIVDTGFSAFLALPREVIVALGLTDSKHARITLADGSIAEALSYILEVSWLGQRRRIIAVEVGGPALLGMEMMVDCRLEIDVVPGGPVTIAPLP